jgi:CrcB protein
VQLGGALFRFVQVGVERPAILTRMKLDRRELAAVFVGGAAGALARVALVEIFPSADANWPWAVFAINISGAFLLGWLVTRLQERLPLSTYRRQLMGTGFCGAYTTFSTMQLELLHMVDAHRYGLAGGYLGASLVCGYVAIYAATAITRRVRVIA